MKTDEIDALKAARKTLRKETERLAFQHAIVRGYILGVRERNKIALATLEDVDGRLAKRPSPRRR
jgi:hypothetical protein